MKDKDDKRTMTKEQAYDAGLYKFSPPPVCTIRWTKADWMKAVTYTVPVK